MLKALVNGAMYLWRKNMNENENYGFEDHYIDEWCMKAEAHYHFTILDVAELISIYGWQQVLFDILEAEKKT